MTPPTNQTPCLPITDSYACSLITAGFKATHDGRITSVSISAAVVVALLVSQSRALIKALVGKLIAIGRNPTGLRAVPCGMPMLPLSPPALNEVIVFTHTHTHTHTTPTITRTY